MRLVGIMSGQVYIRNLQPHTVYYIVMSTRAEATYVKTFVVKDGILVDITRRISGALNLHHSEPKNSAIVPAFEHSTAQWLQDQLNLILKYRPTIVGL